MKSADSQPLSIRIIKGSSVVLLFTTATAPLGYLVRMMLSRTLSIEMYGLYFAMISFFSFFVTYTDLGFGYSLSYFFPKFYRKKDYRTCWNLYTYDQLIVFGTSLTLSAVLYVSASWLAHQYFKVPEAESLIKIFCVYFIANSIVSALNKLYNGLQKEVYYASMELIRFLFLIIFAFVYYLKQSHDVSVYAWGLASSYIFVAVIYRLFLQKNFTALVHRSITWNAELFRTMATYALPTIMTTFVYTIISFSDTFILTFFRGIREVGIYNVMIPIVSVFAIFISPINYFLFPLISHHIETDPKKVRTLLHYTLRIVPFACFYFAIFIILFPNPLIAILFGNKWSNTYAVALSILAIGYTVSTLTSFFTTFAIGLGKVRERLRVSFVIAAFSIIFGLVFIPTYGVLGVACSFTTTSMLSLILLGNIVKTKLHFHYPFGFYIKIMVVGALLFGIARTLKLAPTDWFTLIVYGIIYTVIMGATGFVLRVYPDLQHILSRPISRHPTVSEGSIR